MQVTWHVRVIWGGPLMRIFYKAVCGTTYVMWEHKCFHHSKSRLQDGVEEGFPDYRQARASTHHALQPSGKMRRGRSSVHLFPLVLQKNWNMREYVSVWLFGEPDQRASHLASTKTGERTNNSKYDLIIPEKINDKQKQMTNLGKYIHPHAAFRT